MLYNFTIPQHTSNNNINEYELLGIIERALHSRISY